MIEMHTAASEMQDLMDLEASEVGDDDGGGEVAADTGGGGDEDGDNGLVYL